MIDLKLISRLIDEAIEKETPESIAEFLRIHPDPTMLDRITPDNITEVADNEVFVFGSNTVGRHGKGAAKTAMKWGAKYGQGEGLMGRTYGIPTKGHDMRVSLQLKNIEMYVVRFGHFADLNPRLTFLVTEIGCGLAGFKPKDIAPMFTRAAELPNVHLPASFWRHIK